VTKRKTRLNGSNEIARSVDRSLEEYFKRLDGETPTGVYDMVIGHVERALLASIMTRTEGNQTQAADMLGIGEPTVRTHLQRIFSKTGTSKQTELLALFLRTAPPVRSNQEAGSDLPQIGREPG